MFIKQYGVGKELNMMTRNMKLSHAIVLTILKIFVLQQTVFNLNLKNVKKEKKNNVWKDDIHVSKGKETVKIIKKYNT